MNKSMTPQILHAGNSAIFLPESSSLRRLPRAHKRKRGQKFWDGFEDKALIYDLFWHFDGERVLLIGPPALNLERHWRSAKFIALPSGKPLSPVFHHVRSTLTVALQQVPPQTRQIQLEFAGETFVAAIQPNMVKEFADARVLFTMSKDNCLTWIAEWALFHHITHGANAVILIDNGSETYRPEDVAKTLAGVPGIDKVLVISWPYKYGPHDPGVVFHRFWANFLQVASFAVILRRFGRRAFGLLNVDIDELAGPLAGTNIFQAARESQDGYFRLLGHWVEAVPEPDYVEDAPGHPAYRNVRRDIRHRLNAKKWGLDPTRSWLDDLDVLPSVHRVMNISKEMSARAPRGHFWHFKGINTNWKHDRLGKKPPKTFMLKRPDELREMFETYLEQKNRGTNKS